MAQAVGVRIPPWAHPLMKPLLLPSFWEPLLKRYIKKTFYAGTRKKGFADREEFTEGDYRFFAEGVRRLNIAFTQERGSLPRNYFHQKDLRSGYLLYFLPVNALKVAALLAQTSPLSPLSLIRRGDGGEVRILDLGSGSGTGMFGTFLWLENLFKKGGALTVPLHLSWILIDQNRQALQDATQLHEELVDHWKKTHPNWPLHSEIQTQLVDLISAPSIKVPAQSVDLVLALNLMNELPQERRIRLIDRAMHFLKPEGRFLIMEPALQRTTRQLMELHDEILERNAAFVYAPCLHQSRCPMLASNHRDWCHTTIEWERPFWIGKLDHLVGIRKDYLQCSYLVLGTQPPRPVSNQRWRVVSGHLNSKGKSELLLCGPAGLPGLQRVTRLDRDWSEKNRPFDDAHRGDLLEMEKCQ